MLQNACLYCYVVAIKVVTTPQEMKSKSLVVTFQKENELCELTTTVEVAATTIANSDSGLDEQVTDNNGTFVIFLHAVVFRFGQCFFFAILVVITEAVKNEKFLQSLIKFLAIFLVYA